MPDKSVPIQSYAPAAPPFGEPPAEPVPPDAGRIRFLLGLADAFVRGMGIDRATALELTATMFVAASEPGAGYGEVTREELAASAVLCRRLAHRSRCAAAGRSS